MESGSDLRIQVRPDVVFRLLGPGAVLVNLADNQVFELNESGAAAWAKLSLGLPVSDAARHLVSVFQVEWPEAHASVERLVADLRRAGLVE